MRIRTYHELTEPDRSGLAAQIVAQRRRVAQRLAGVARLIAVMSGKGGVGKSYVTAHAARALARVGRRVAVLTVTIPTAESGDAVRRALRAALERGATPLGIVENMVGGAFVGEAGDTLAREFGTPLLARVPWHPTPDVWQQLAETIWNAV